MSKKTIAKIITFFCIGIVCIILAATFTTYLVSYGFDYTEEYKVYQEVKDLKSLTEVRQKLQDLKLEYTVNGKELTLKKYYTISFSVNSDDSCIIAQNLHMSSFQKLDTEDRTVVEIHGIKQEDKIVEKLSLDDDIFTFTKIGNKYYAKNNVFYVWCAFAYIFAALFIFCGVVDLITSRKKAKE